MFEKMKERFQKLTSNGDRKQSSSDEGANWLNLVCFYVFGTLTFFNQEMLNMASQDILSGRNLPTATILLCTVGGEAIIKITVPWFMERISYTAKVSLIALSMTVALVMVVFVEHIEAKLGGIALNAAAASMAENVFLALSSFYPPDCLTYLVAGTGMSSLASSLHYNGLTTWSCVSPKIAILISIPLSLLWLVFFALLNKDSILSDSHSTGEHKDIEYAIIDSTQDSAEELPSTPESLSCHKKFGIGLKILPFIIPLFISFFADLLSISSVVTTIAFPQSKLLPRDHFTSYYFSYIIGKFTGRTYLLIMTCIWPDASKRLTFDKTWIFAVLEMAHLIFFLFESWYHFVPHIWFIFPLCCTLGAVSGLMLLNSFHAVSQHVSPEEREFALGLTSIGNPWGQVAAAFVGLALEPLLIDKCIEHFPATKEFCFTRQRNTTGWEHNIHC